MSQNILLGNNPHSLAYENSTRNIVSFCTFSQCGKYFGFVEKETQVGIYKTSFLWHTSSQNENEYTSVPIDIQNGENSASNVWVNVTDEASPKTFRVNPVFTISSRIPVTALAFGEGQLSACRLPHRLVKRRSRVVKSEHVNIIAIAHSNGFIDVYSLDELKNCVPTLAKMVLVDGNRPIIHLNMASDGSLRLASVDSKGVVKLWDIWDEGNMYVTLTSPDANCTINSLEDLDNHSQSTKFGYNHEVSVTAWHPFAPHIFLGDVHGYGLVVQAEAPFRCLTFIHHHNRISGACYSRDGGLLLTSSFDGSCIAWALPSYTRVHCYWHTEAPRNVSLLGGANGFHVSSLAFSPDSQYFATICEDRYLRIWPMSPDRKKILVKRVNFEWTSMHRHSLAFSPCGQFLAVSLGNTDLTILVYPRKSIELASLCIHSIRKRVVKVLLGPSIAPNFRPCGVLPLTDDLIDVRNECGSGTTKSSARNRKRFSTSSKNMPMNLLFAAFASFKLPWRLVQALCYTLPINCERSHSQPSVTSAHHRGASLDATTYEPLPLLPSEFLSSPILQ